MKCQNINQKQDPGSLHTRNKFTLREQFVNNSE